MTPLFKNELFTSQIQKLLKKDLLEHTSVAGTMAEILKTDSSYSLLIKCTGYCKKKV